MDTIYTEICVVLRMETIHIVTILKNIIYFWSTDVARDDSEKTSL